MSENITIKEQADEVEAAVRERIAGQNINIQAVMQQNMDRTQIEQRIGREEIQTENSQVIAAIQETIESCRNIAVQLYQNFEDTADTFDGDVGELWRSYKQLEPWQKILIATAALAIISLIGGTAGYFSWQFICYIWPTLLEFGITYGPTISAHGIPMLNYLENSPTVRNFTTNLENRTDELNFDTNGWQGLQDMELGLPTVFEISKYLLNFMSTLPK